MIITKGFTFTDASGQAGNTCSAANLHSLVDGATFSGMVISDFSSTQKPVFVSGSTPVDPTIGQLWFLPKGTPADPQGVFLVWDGSVWQLAGEGIRLTNKSGATVNYGDTVVLDTANANSFTSTASLANTAVIGIVGETIEDNDSGIIITRGLVALAPGNTSGTVTRFNYLRTATVALQCRVDLANIAASGAAFGLCLDDTNLICYITGLLVSR